MDNRIAKACLAIAALLTAPAAALAQNIVVDAAPSHVANSFSPYRALGAAIDLSAPPERDAATLPPAPKSKSTSKRFEQSRSQGNPGRGMANRQLPPEHRAPHRSLALESQRHLEQRRQTGGLLRRQRQARPEPIKHSWAYPLPHRGSTPATARLVASSPTANRIPTGRAIPTSPSGFTGEADSLHPQWIMIDLGSGAHQRHSHRLGQSLRADTTTCSSGPARASPSPTAAIKGAWKTVPEGQHS